MPVRLDERLSLIASLVHYGRVADIGCDHGKLGYFLVSTGRACYVIATDISRGSLEKARVLALDNGAEKLMETRLGDGLEPIGKREVDTVIIAGLGGDVISGILARAREDGKEFAHYILSPNTHPEKVRRELANWDHNITYDGAVRCSDKIYTVIKTDEGEKENLDKSQILFGKYYASDKNFREEAERELRYKESLCKANPSSDSLKAQVNALKKALGVK